METHSSMDNAGSGAELRRDDKPEVYRERTMRPLASEAKPEIGWLFQKLAKHAVVSVMLFLSLKRTGADMQTCKTLAETATCTPGKPRQV